MLVMRMGGCNVVGPAWLTSVGVGRQLSILSLRFSWASSDGDQVPSQQVQHKSFIMIYWGDLYRNNLPLSMFLKVRVNGFNLRCWSSTVNPSRDLITASEAHTVFHNSSNSENGHLHQPWAGVLPAAWSLFL